MSSDLLGAAKNGYFGQVVNLLTDGSCDVNARDKDKATPLYWSASRGHRNICELLIQAGCDVNACVKWGSTALHAAADRGHIDCLAILINSGAHLNVQNERGDTALHLAAYRGFRDLVQLLVDAQADPFAKNGQSKTALQEAQSQGHASAAAVLCKYIESLGCPTFKSLPTSETTAVQTTQDKFLSSGPAHSSPRFQSFPKSSNHIPPFEASRPYTHPLKLEDQISVGNVSLYGLKSLPFVGSGSENMLINLKDFKRFKEKIPRHSQSEPQENVDECIGLNKVQVSKDTSSKLSDQYNPLDPLLDVPSIESGLQVMEHFRPVKTDTGNHRRSAMNPDIILSKKTGSGDKVLGNENVQTISDRMNSAHCIHNEMCTPDIVPPRNPIHRPESFVKHEDLTLFAESLQLEVVKLRDSLAGRDHKISELQDMISSLSARNVHLEQQSVEQSVAADRALAAKECHNLEMKKKLSDCEKQNLYLQQSLKQEQSNVGKLSAERHSQVSELVSRMTDLEQLNTSLHQLIVAQQDSMKWRLSSKDREIALLTSQLNALSQKPASVNAAIALPNQPTADAAVTYGQSSVPPTNSLVSQKNVEMVSYGGVGAMTPEVTTSVIPNCDPHLRPSSVQTQTQTHKLAPYLPSSTPESIETLTMSHRITTTQSQRSTNVSPGLTLPSKMPADSVSSSDLEQCKLRALVSRHFRNNSDAWKLDADDREWHLGREFQLLDTNPVNCSADGQRRGSSSLVFSIVHQGRKYMLKMLMNVINLSYEGHSSGRSLDAHLLPRFGAEFHAPLLLQPHPNIVRVRHHYQGDTSQFRNYLPFLVPPNLDVPVEMARRTTFLVLEHYSETLTSFMSRHSVTSSIVHQGGGLSGQFILQLVYQLLSAVEYLQRHDIVHRDIKEDNVFLDWRLRPVLGDFGFARTLCGHDGQAVPFTDSDQAYAGNPHAWAPELCRWSRASPESLLQSLTLREVYAKSDGYAVARMFYHLFHSNDSFPVSSKVRPHYADSEIGLLPHPVPPRLAYLLKLLVLDDPKHRPTVRQVLSRVGVLLCLPCKNLRSVHDADEFCASQLLELSSQRVTRPVQPSEGTIGLEESVAANQNHCVADFLLNFGGKDFWEAYSELMKEDG